MEPRKTEDLARFPFAITLFFMAFLAFMADFIDFFAIIVEMKKVVRKSRIERFNCSK